MAGSPGSRRPPLCPPRAPFDLDLAAVRPDASASEQRGAAAGRPAQGPVRRLLHRVEALEHVLHQQLGGRGAALERLPPARAARSRLRRGRARLRRSRRRRLARRGQLQRAVVVVGQALSRITGASACAGQTARDERAPARSLDTAAARPPSPRAAQAGRSSSARAGTCAPSERPCMRSARCGKKRRSHWRRGAQRPPGSSARSRAPRPAASRARIRARAAAPWSRPRSRGAPAQRTRNSSRTSGAARRALRSARRCDSPRDRARRTGSRAA